MMKFEVKVIGHPKPSVKWLKQGEEITQSEEFQIENLDDGTSILIINDVYPDDTGEIKFEAYNAVGVAQTITNFEVVEGEGIFKFIAFKYKQFSGFLNNLRFAAILIFSNSSCPPQRKHSCSLTHFHLLFLFL